LVRDYDAVWRRWEQSIGFARLHCLHLNDSKTPLGSRRDRHELVGEGSLGPEPFRRIMRDPRFRSVMKVIETPKGDDEFTFDRRMLRRLRAYARAAR
jgi:deoxyribonuclease-4